MSKSDSRLSLERIAALPAERWSETKAGSAKAPEDVHLADIRKAMQLTQVEAAACSGLKQSEISPVERVLEIVQLRTLWNYAARLRGTARIVMNFPDGTSCLSASIKAS